MSNDAFKPIIDRQTNLNTCVQVATGAASARIELDAREVLIKCLTKECWIRLGGPNVTVSATNGYYMAVGDEVRWQTSRGANSLAYIQQGSAGALSICPGLAE